MAFRDLRQFLDFLSDRHDLMVVEREVSPVHEAAACIRATSKIAFVAPPASLLP